MSNWTRKIVCILSWFTELQSGKIFEEIQESQCPKKNLAYGTWAQSVTEVLSYKAFDLSILPIRQN